MRALAIHFIMVAASAIALNAQQPAGSIDAPEGARVVLMAKGDGVQIYSCTDSPAGIKWMLKGPDAKLLDAGGKVIGAHFAGPTWKLNDGGQVQGELLANKPSPEAVSLRLLLFAERKRTVALRPHQRAKAPQTRARRCRFGTPPPTLFTLKNRSCTTDILGQFEGFLGRSCPDETVLT
jgi:hypothetical protein